MPKQLDGLRWERCWMSQMGCLKACLAYLGSELSWPSLYGLTAQAFIINMHETCCPSGPTAWRSAELFGALLPNLGATLEVAPGGTWEGTLAEAQGHAWELARRYLNAGHPVYAWEMLVPEFYVVHGVDQTGYYYSGPHAEDGAGPRPWQELGTTGTGVVSVVGLRPCAPNSLQVALTDAIETALRHADPDDPWSGPGYHRGPAAFEVWATALENGTAGEFGHRYCAAVWAETRHHGMRFLHELADSLPGAVGAAAEAALAAYRRVNNVLGAVSAEHVFLALDHIPDGQTLQDEESAHMLRQAAKAEAEGLEALRQLAAALPD